MGYNSKRFVKIEVNEDMIRKLAIAKTLFGLQGDTPEKQLRDLITWKLQEAQKYEDEEVALRKRAALVFAGAETCTEDEFFSTVFKDNNGDEV